MIYRKHIITIMNKDDVKDYTYGFKVGDLITTYQKGIYKIVGVKNRFCPNGEEASAEISFIKVLNDDGTIVSGKKVYTCSAFLCNTIDELLKRKKEEANRWLNFINNNK